jgi:hypothetical protein
VILEWLQGLGDEGAVERKKGAFLRQILLVARGCSGLRQNRHPSFPGGTDEASHGMLPFSTLKFINNHKGKRVVSEVRIEVRHGLKECFWRRDDNFCGEIRHNLSSLSEGDFAMEDPDLGRRKVKKPQELRLSLGTEVYIRSDVGDSETAATLRRRQR